MWRRYIDVSLRLVVGLVLTANTAIAQDEDVPEHLNFEQFKVVVDADELEFYETLTYEWMKFVNAPAAERVVLLYEYEAELIEEARLSCSDPVYTSGRALLVNSAVSRSVLVGRDDLPSISDSNLVNGEWVLVDAFDEFDEDEKRGILDSEFEEVEPFWYEASYADLCGLQRLVQDRDNSLNWKLVNDEKLEKIHDVKLAKIYHNELSVDTWTTHVIVAEPIPEIEGDYGKYFAECRDGSSILTRNRSLCN